MGFLSKKGLDWFIFITFCLFSTTQPISLFMKKKSPSKGLLTPIVSNSFLIMPHGENQEKYVSYLSDKEVKLVLGIGPAGTGKTAFACQQAIHDFKQGVVDKIIITRPVVPVEDEEIGFLPGNIDKKMAPWTQPIFDVFMQHYSPKEIDWMLQFHVIEIAPLAFMRGRTFRKSFVIADEMQNSSPKQMLMLTSRLGVDSKMVITGDFGQSDRDKRENGLMDFLQRLKTYESYDHPDRTFSKNLIRTIQFTNTDIQRSEIVKNIMDIYDFVVPVPVSDPSPSPSPSPSCSNHVPRNNMTNPISRVLNDAAMIPNTHMSKYYPL